MNGETKFLSRSQFAAERGWSPSYVTKLGKQDRLVLSADGKLIDVAATMALLQRTEDPGKDAIRHTHAAARVEKGVTSQVKHDTPSDVVVPATADPKYWDNKARREGALADLAEFEVYKQSSELKARIRDIAFSHGRTIRDAVLGLPTRLSPVIASMTDAFQVETLLRNELRQVFIDFEKKIQEDSTRSIEHAA